MDRGSTADDPNATAELAILPWQRYVPQPEHPVLHLVVAWFQGEPDLLGSCAPLTVAARLGHGGSAPGEPALLRFHRSRPDENVHCPLRSTELSRSELAFEPGHEGRDVREVRVKRIGPRALFHNGSRVEECTVRSGDTLMLERTAVFFVESRPLLLPPCWYFRAASFSFGGPDSYGLVGESPESWRHREALAMFASWDRILLTGEAGSGKAVAARAIHALSRRASGRLVRSSAASLRSRALLRELFGSIANYPDPDTPEREGLVGQADGGTFVLDEIGLLSHTDQRRLSQVLDDAGTYYRVGCSTPRRSDFQFIGTTYLPERALLPDTAARLTVKIGVPGLDERRSDIPWLAQELMRRLASEMPPATAQFSDGSAFRVDPALIDALLRHRYTRHVRELDRLLKISVVTSRGAFLALTPEVSSELRVPSGQRTGERNGPEETSRQRVVECLAEAGGNLGLAAEALCMTRAELLRLMRDHGLPDA